MDQEQPRLRMDRSRDFSTVHGERGPDDRHAAVQFYQDGLPFDAEGLCIADHPEMLAATKDGEAKRALFDKRLKAAIKRGKAVVGKPKKKVRLDADGDPIEDALIEDEDEDEDEDGDEGGSADADEIAPEENNVNLEAWARGEQKYRFDEVTQRIAAIYKKRVMNKKDAAEFLIEERVVSKGQLSAELRKIVD